MPCGRCRASGGTEAVNRKQERAAWTAAITGEAPQPVSKYFAQRTGAYASKHEATTAAKLHTLMVAGVISELREQVPFVLVEGRGKVRGIKYVADFVFKRNGHMVVADAKGYAKNPVYLLKKKLMYLLHNVEIEEL